ncbi:MAG: protein-L-isoaspartate(D-aspartate) O-methyltransferase [Robiginitomaculum sp.]|nr:protein-L-isoaspartate(D-aspartate) O-methyltransferase [Robiginitomaculum sp.]
MAKVNLKTVELILALRGSGISDHGVLSAIETTPRELFVTPEFSDQAWEDRALPIACGQTISQPMVVGQMTEALCLTGREKVLEVGTGSGYQCAILSKLARRVYTIERYRTLLEEAKRRFAALKLRNIVPRLGDGGQGWPEQDSFDRIIMTAAAEKPPPALLAQLRDHGLMVAPIGSSGRQKLTVYRRDGDVFHEHTLDKVRFVPLLPGIARTL